MTHIVWCRQALRLAHNPALLAASQSGQPVLPVYLHTPAAAHPWPQGGASQWWLHHGLTAFAARLEAMCSPLIIQQGEHPLPLLQALIAQTGATVVHTEARWEPAARAQEAEVAAALATQGVTLHCYNDSLLHHPAALRNLSGQHFKVFTPFWKRCLVDFLGDSPPLLLPHPQPWAVPASLPPSLPLEALGLLPTVPWDATMKTLWDVSEAGAERQLQLFLAQGLGGYGEDRNLLALAVGTSKLSPYLHGGQLSPHQVWHAVQAVVAEREACGVATPTFQASVKTYLSELGWREFAHHLLWYYPTATHQPIRPEFSAFPWQEDEAVLRAWQQGKTGYPIVDAGMRELWATGWMHNRVRMIVASFLTKHLLQPWQAGAAWFWDTLLDADLASNSLSWQWVSGCGADAAPYFRIFNPLLQSQKFDASGEYIRQWVPELAALPTEHVHAPSAAPPLLLHRYGVTLGETYPYPMVEHTAARDRALAFFKSLPKTT